MYICIYRDIRDGNWLSKLKFQILLSTIIFFHCASLPTVVCFSLQLLNEGDLIFFCRKNRSRALPVQVEENTFEDCPSFSRNFCSKYKFISPQVYDEK